MFLKANKDPSFEFLLTFTEQATPSRSCFSSSTPPCLAIPWKRPWRAAPWSPRDLLCVLLGQKRPAVKGRVCTEGGECFSVVNEQWGPDMLIANSLRDISKTAEPLKKKYCSQGETQKAKEVGCL